MNNEDTNKLIQVGTLDKPEWIEARRRVYSPEGICPTLNGIGQGGNTEPKIIVVGTLDIKIVSEILGHKDVSFTYNVYVHILEEQKIQAMNLLDDI